MIDTQTAMVVRSKAGRDKGQWMAVLSTDGEFATVANGKSRRLESPKRKCLKHLAPTGEILDVRSLSTNRELRAALAAYGERCDEEGD